MMIKKLKWDFMTSNTTLTFNFVYLKLNHETSIKFSFDQLNIVFI